MIININQAHMASGDYGRGNVISTPFLFDGGIEGWRTDPGLPSNGFWSGETQGIGFDFGVDDAGQDLTGVPIIRYSGTLVLEVIDAAMPLPGAFFFSDPGIQFGQFFEPLPGDNFQDAWDIFGLEGSETELPVGVYPGSFLYMPPSPVALPSNFSDMACVLGGGGGSAAHIQLTSIEIEISPSIFWERFELSREEQL